jgi:hypothetical protein
MSHSFQLMDLSLSGFNPAGGGQSMPEAGKQFPVISVEPLI